MTSLSAPTAIDVAPPPMMRRVHDMADSALGPRGCLFVFHRGASADRWPTLPNREFYLDLDFLDRLLTYLRDTGWAVVTLDEALARTAALAPGGRFVNFSIDDCYRDTFEAVVPLFRRHNVPVTLFVTTGIPDGTLPLWAAGLEEALLQRDSIRLGETVVPTGSAQEKRDAFARIARQWDGPQAGIRYRDFCADNGIDAAAVHERHAISWAMLDEIKHDPAVEIGAHSVNHSKLSSLAAVDAAEELRGSRARLEARLGIAVRHFAFPYGRSCDCGPRDVALAREAGFASVATTSRGLIHRSRGPFVLPRNTINGAHKSLPMMEAHLTGLAGAAARIIGRV